ncbi:uncharacterized protein LOC134833300 [Culicoides brevitarsis]|uniref:uncharacterized protein LOC134833300 n=1 Tax=Culicoides brevitarsis TaxID=469753 RepID=UPI00307C82B0
MMDVLNDDCLREILKFLQPHELLRLYGVCRRFDYFIDEIRRKIHSFEFQSISGTRWESEKIHETLAFVGPSVKSLVINRGILDIPNLTLFELIHQLCPKLESLNVYRCTLRSTDILNELTFVVKNLKSIILTDCIFNNELGECFAGADKLENLSIYYNNGINEDFFKHIKNLQSLSVIKCSSIKPKEMLKNNLTLKKLNVKQSFHMNNDFINFITHNLTSLEDLEFSVKSDSDVKISCFGEMPNLKRLSICGGSREFTTIIREFDLLMENLNHKKIIEQLELSWFHRNIINSVSKLTNLKSLSLNFMDLPETGLKNLEKLKKLEHAEFLSEWISKNDIIEIVKDHKNLKYLKIDHSMDIEFLEKIIAILKISKRLKLEIKSGIGMITNKKTTKQKYHKLLNENSHILTLIEYY